MDRLNINSAIACLKDMAQMWWRKGVCVGPERKLGSP